MVQIIGRNQNTNDTATVSSAITLNATTSVLVAAANPNRTYLRIDGNSSNQGIWIKLQATADDNDKKGIFIQANTIGVSHWEMPFDNIYTGEVCAIADANGPAVYITEY